jgi:hypothetical protein
MEHNHFFLHHSVLGLTTVNDHRAFVVNSGVILSDTDRYAFCFENVDCEVVAIVLHDLICALSNLTLPIEHKATAEYHNFTLVRNG